MSGMIDVLVFKAALGNEAYLAEINSTPKNQLHFIATLEENKFAPQEIQELIGLVKDQKIRSLLITHLLSQKEYLIRLKGESFLDKITYGGSQASPSRLNAWVHQLDNTILTPAIIAKLDPEAAVTILCSVPHFHQLTEAQVNALMSKYLRPALINYWVNHFASMPNAHYVLAHLIKLVHVNVLDAWLMKNKEPLLSNQFRLLELFLKERSLDEITGLAKQIHNRSDKLNRVTDELDCVVPEAYAAQITKISTKTPDVVTTATETFSVCVKEASEYAQSAWSWASNISGGLFSTTTEPTTTKPGKTEISLAAIIAH